MSLRIGRQFEALSRPPATHEMGFGDYSVLATPNKPDYTYGNLIIAGATSRQCDLLRHLQLWKQHFTGTGSTRPVVALEQGGRTLPNNFKAEAEKFDLKVHLADLLEFSSYTQVGVKCPLGLVLRPIEEEWEWDELQQGWAAEDNFGILDLQRWLVMERRKLVERGRGTWWGTFRGDSLIASCGAFYSEKWARFEQLRVDSKHRCRGMASFLVSTLTSIYREKRIVVELLHDSRLSAFYQRLGYVPIGIMCTLVGKLRGFEN
jgi:hypothetical protein